MKTERAALLLSAFTALAMAGLGVGFATLTGSRVILLDAVFNLVYLGVAVATLRVARIARQPDTPEFPFGYAYFESLVNAGKGLVILGVSALALVDSVSAIIGGGTEIAAGLAIGYAALATALCGATALALRRARAALASPLVDADVDNWLLNAVISAAVLAGFCTAVGLRAAGWEQAALYVDPVLVLAVVLLFLGVPIRIARQAILELLNRAPDPVVTRPVTDAIDAALAALPVRERHVRMVRPGRTLYVVVHTVLANDADGLGLRELDRVRGEIDAAVRALHPRVLIDVLFTTERRWALPSAGLAAPRDDTGP
ncbi:MAG: cation transporter [Halofilum sp. (in: g-proteobacteria)]|nr:cation transporter [Halofilum sp. (in: g-proteobacteria)]